MILLNGLACLFSLALAAFSQGASFLQSATGTLGGTITDPDGTAIDNARSHFRSRRELSSKRRAAMMEALIYPFPPWAYAISVASLGLQPFNGKRSRLQLDKLCASTPN
jgi:hypothetical protein